jgi:hypothetical protein
MASQKMRFLTCPLNAWWIYPTRQDKTRQDKTTSMQVVRNVRVRPEKFQKLHHQQLDGDVIIARTHSRDFSGQNLIEGALERKNA